MPATWRAAAVSRPGAQAQAQRWLAEAVRSELGRRGLERAERAGALALAPGEAPFGALHRLLAALAPPAR